MPTFAKVPAEKGGECWHRTTSLASSSASRCSIVCRLTGSVSAANSFLKCAIFRSATVLSMACLCRLHACPQALFGMTAVEKKGPEARYVGIMLRFASLLSLDCRIGSDDESAKSLLVSLRDGHCCRGRGLRAPRSFAAIFCRPHLPGNLYTGCLVRGFCRRDRPGDVAYRSLRWHQPVPPRPGACRQPGQSDRRCLFCGAGSGPRLYRRAAAARIRGVPLQTGAVAVDPRYRAGSDDRHRRAWDHAILQHDCRAAVRLDRRGGDRKERVDPDAAALPTGA